jgi:hypothetical protein
VAAEVFLLDPARLMLSLLDGLELRRLRDAMKAVDAERMTAGAVGPLVSESGANVVAAGMIPFITRQRAV